MTKNDLLRILKEVPDDFEINIKIQEHYLDTFEYGFPDINEYYIPLEGHDIMFLDKKIILAAKEIH